MTTKARSYGRAGTYRRAGAGSLTEEMARSAMRGPSDFVDLVADVWVASGAAKAQNMNAPRVYLVEPPTPDTLGGRYFPRLNVALVYAHQDEEVQRATAIHETTHAVNYSFRCGGNTRTRCGYVGQHDRKFYVRLEPLYRNFGVPVDVARAVESDCRGDYACPARWRRITKW